MKLDQTYYFSGSAYEEVRKKVSLIFPFQVMQVDVTQETERN